MDIIRVLRVLEYVGPRDLVETQIENSIHGTRTIPRGQGRSIRITAVTVGEFGDVISTETAASLFTVEGD